ncbi:MAG: DUF1961 family protein [bacterium]|nr:DUF1961 family protein [bacterium]
MWCFVGMLILLVIGTPPAVGQAPAGRGEYAVKLEQPISQQGFVSFILKTDKTYLNGKGSSQYSQPLLKLPGLASCFMTKTDFSVRLAFVWTQQDPFERSFQLDLPLLPGPESYLLQFTWDSERGYSEGYINGVPLRSGSAHFEPFSLQGQAVEAIVPGGAIEVSEVTVLPSYLAQEEAKELVPTALRNKGFPLWTPPQSDPGEIDQRKGELLYESNMSMPAAVDGWILEGPGIVSFEDQRLVLRSTNPNSPNRGEGHVNFWCPEDFPSSFVAEWEFEALSEHGLSIVFFSAKANNGLDIFDPSLPARNGSYPQYTTGAISNYHIIYSANLPLFQTGRPYSSMRKGGPGFYEIAHGPIAVAPGSKGVHKLRLMKDGDRIVLMNQSEVLIDFKDSANRRWGPALAGGKFAFRQMAVTVGAYRNLKVWALK